MLKSGKSSITTIDEVYGFIGNNGRVELTKTSSLYRGRFIVLEERPGRKTLEVNVFFETEDPEKLVDVLSINRMFKGYGERFHVDGEISIFNCNLMIVGNSRIALDSK